MSSVNDALQTGNVVWCASHPCVPVNLKQERVTLAHGSGGLCSSRLVYPVCWGAASWWCERVAECYGSLSGQQEAV